MAGFPGADENFPIESKEYANFLDIWYKNHEI